MAKPVSRILVVEDDPLVLRDLVRGLNAAARSLDNPLGEGRACFFPDLRVTDRLKSDVRMAKDQWHPGASEEKGCAASADPARFEVFNLIV